jgi:hypothetical protein
MGHGARSWRRENGEEEMIETVKERNGEGENGRMGEKEKGEGKVEIGKS